MSAGSARGPAVRRADPHSAAPRGASRQSSTPSAVGGNRRDRWSTAGGSEKVDSGGLGKAASGPTAAAGSGVSGTPTAGPAVPPAVPPPPSIGQLNDLRRQQLAEKAAKKAQARRAAAQRSRSPGAAAMRSNSPLQPPDRRGSASRSPSRAASPTPQGLLAPARGFHPRSVSPGGGLYGADGGRRSPLRMAVHGGGHGGSEYRSPSPMLKGIPRGMVENFGIEPQDLKIDKGKELGTGGFGIVYQGDYQATEVAVKVASTDLLTPDLIQEWKREVQIMTRLRHPNILMLLGAVFEQNQLAIVTELCERGTLLKVLQQARARRRDEPPDDACYWATRIDWLGQIARGMAFLHHKRIFHRDLKPSNVFVAQGGVMKIADFGLSRIRKDIRRGLRAALPEVRTQRALDPTQPPASAQSQLVGPGVMKENSRIQGTFAFIAPEVWAEHPYTEKGDVYSFGMATMQVFTIDIPFESDSRKELSWRIMQGKTRPRIPTYIGGKPFPRGLSLLIHDCICYLQADRPFFTDIVTRLKDELQEPYAARESQCPWPLPSEVDHLAVAEDLAEPGEQNHRASGSDHRRRDRDPPPADRDRGGGRASRDDADREQWQWFQRLPAQQQRAMRRCAAAAARAAADGAPPAAQRRGAVERAPADRSPEEELSRARRSLEQLGGDWQADGRLEGLLIAQAHAEMDAAPSAPPPARSAPSPVTDSDDELRREDYR